MSLSVATALPATARPGLLTRLGRFLARVADQMYRHGTHLHGCCMAMAMLVVPGGA